MQKLFLYILKVECFRQRKEIARIEEENAALKERMNKNNKKAGLYQMEEVVDEIEIQRKSNNQYTVLSEDEIEEDINCEEHPENSTATESSDASEIHEEIEGEDEDAEIFEQIQCGS